MPLVRPVQDQVSQPFALQQFFVALQATDLPVDVADGNPQAPADIPLINAPVLVLEEEGEDLAAIAGGQEVGDARHSYDRCPHRQQL